jgi:hypothetical protein
MLFNESSHSAAFRDCELIIFDDCKTVVLAYFIYCDCFQFEKDFAKNLNQ